MKSLLFTLSCLCLSLTAGAQTAFERRVVVEELTGTRCGWCPRGLAGMAKLRQQFGDRFIGIAVHNYDTNDPMNNRPYAATKLFDGRGAPTCTLDRQYFCDPLHGASGNIATDFEYELNQPCYVGVSVSGTYNEDSTVVEAHATITAGQTMSGLEVLFVLVADSVASNDASFMQYNGYAKSSPDAYPNDPEVHPFCSGGAYGVSPFQWAFDDVCIGNSYSTKGANQVDPVGTLSEGQQAERTFRLLMPTKAVLRRAFDKRKVSVVAIVLDAEGHVANADKQLIGTNVTGIRPLGTHGSRPDTPTFTLSGQRATDGYCGLVIKNGRKQQNNSRR